MYPQEPARKYAKMYWEYLEEATSKQLDTHVYSIL